MVEQLKLGRPPRRRPRPGEIILFNLEEETRPMVVIRVNGDEVDGRVFLANTSIDRRDEAFQTHFQIPFEAESVYMEGVKPGFGTGEWKRR